MLKKQDPQNSRATEICGIFMRAESIAKKIERIDDGMIVPAINQLRYAGHHYVKFSAGIEPEESHDHKCISHCRRAIYDAYEAGITYCLLKFRQFQKDYRKAVITDVFSDYAACCAKANEAHELVKTTDKDERHEKSGEAEKYFDEIFVFTQKLPAIREELNKKIRKDRWAFYTVLATFIVTCFGVGYAVWKDHPIASDKPQVGQIQSVGGSQANPLAKNQSSAQQ